MIANLCWILMLQNLSNKNPSFPSNWILSFVDWVCSPSFFLSLEFFFVVVNFLLLNFYQALIPTSLSSSLFFFWIYCHSSNETYLFFYFFLFQFKRFYSKDICVLFLRCSLFCTISYPCFVLWLWYNFSCIYFIILNV